MLGLLLRFLQTAALTATETAAGNADGSVDLTAAQTVALTAIRVMSGCSADCCMEM